MNSVVHDNRQWYPGYGLQVTSGYILIVFRLAENIYLLVIRKSGKKRFFVKKSEEIAVFWFD